MRHDSLIRHIVFDLDGTLVDSCATCVEILGDMLNERGAGQSIDPVYARTYMSRGGLDMVSGLLGPACLDADADLADFRARYQIRPTSPDTLYPGVADGLARLKAAGYTLSICSNKPQSLCDKVLADTGLASYFTAVVGGAPGLRPKPAPDLLDALLAQLGCTVDACLFVGDSELDHAVAEAAGMGFHFLGHGYAEPGWQPSYGAHHDSFDAMIATILPGGDALHA